MNDETVLTPKPSVPPTPPAAPEGPKPPQKMSPWLIAAIVIAVLCCCCILGALGIQYYLQNSNISLVGLPRLG